MQRHCLLHHGLSSHCHLRYCLSVVFAFLTLANIANAQSPSGFSIFAGTGKSPTTSVVYSDANANLNCSDVLLGNPFGIEVIGQQVWITTVDDQCIWKTSTAGGEIERISGFGKKGYAGDGGVATKAEYNWPHEVRVDSDGNLFVADTRNHVIRRIDGKSGVVTTIAGTGHEGFAGENVGATTAKFSQPHSIVLDHAGGMLVADTKNHRLRRIDLQSGIITTLAGNGERKLPTEGAIASQTALFGPRTLAVDADSIWIALREGNSIWRIDRKTNKIYRVAGTGKKGYAGDGGSAMDATFSGPKGLAIDTQGRLLVVDTENHAIRRIDVKKDSIETVMGGNRAADTFKLKRPHGVAVLPGGGYLIADSENHRVLRGE